MLICFFLLSQLRHASAEFDDWEVPLKNITFEDVLTEGTFGKIYRATVIFEDVECQSRCRNFNSSSNGLDSSVKGESQTVMKAVVKVLEGLQN